MKRTISLLALLLASLMLFASCTNAKNQENNTDNNQENDSTSEELFEINGIWYSNENNTVLDVTNMENISFYTLMVGFYEYQNVTTLDATYGDNVLVARSEYGETLTWVFDPTKDTLKLNDSVSYVRKSELPTAYQLILFPDFSKIDFNSFITLGDYKSLTLLPNAKLYAAVSIFDQYYDYIVQDPKTITGRNAQMGDYVNIDYTGTDYTDDPNGEVFEGGTASNVKLLIDAESGYIPGFAEGIEGHAVGSTFDVTVTFPENYHSEEMAGKTVVFTMTLNQIYDLTLSDEEIAELTDSEYTSYEEYLDYHASFNYFDNFYEQLCAIVSYDTLPEETTAFFYQYYNEMYHYYANYYGMEFDEFLTMAGVTVENIKAQAKDAALPYVITFAIAKAEGLEVNEEDYEAEVEASIQDLIQNNGYTQEEAMELIEQNGTNGIYADLTYNMVMEWLLETVKAAA